MSWTTRLFLFIPIFCKRSITSISLYDVHIKPLNFLIYHPFIKERGKEISFEAVHSGAGYSGTENAIIELSRYLVSIGHKVTILGLTRTSFKSVGISFKPYTGRLKKGLDWKPLLKDVHVFTPIFYLEDNIVSQIIKFLSSSKITSIWIWFQSFPGNNDYNTGLTLLRSAGRTVLCSFVSNFSRDAYLPQYRDLCSHSVTIGNGVSSYFLNHSDGTRSRGGNWVFHALFERGGEVAERVFMRVKDVNPMVARHLHFASYVPAPASSNTSIISSSSSSSSPAVTFHGPLSKKNISELLGRSDYFPYMLVDAKTSNVHHDTYATVVLEALARGVIVITWDVACFRDVFGDTVIRVPVRQQLGETEYDSSARTGYNSWMASPEAVDIMAQTLLHLESNPEEKQRKRTAGRNWASRFSWDRIGNQYAQWFTDVFS